MSSEYDANVKDSEHVEALIKSMVDDMNNIASVREIILVTGNYIDSLMDIIITQFLARPDVESRTDFRDYFLKKIRLDFKQKLDILKHYNLIPSKLYKLIEDVMHKRNVIAHNVKYMELLSTKNSVPGYKNLIKYLMNNFKLIFPIIFVKLQNCQHLISYPRDKIAERCEEINKELENEDIIKFIFEGE